LTCVISGLSNGTTYTATVRALSGAGWSANSSPSNAFTPTAGVVLVLNQGTRRADGSVDRISTTGSSKGIPAGTLLTPYIRYGPTGAFIKGTANIVVTAKGNFRWSRVIRKDKAVTGYVMWTSSESNRVTWLKVR
jgi:hypothetical protein